jgi:hypothetical protein
VGVEDVGVALEARAADGDVDDLRALAGGVVHAGRDGAGRARAVGAEHLDGQDLRLRGDAGHRERVVAAGVDHARDGGAVAAVVGGVVVAVVEVPAADVVDAAVAVVVAAVAGDLARVDVARAEVGCRRRARVHHGDAGAGALGDVPRGERVDVGAGAAAELARVAPGPLAGEVGVVRAGQGAGGDVGLRPRRVVVAGQLGGRGALGPRGDVEDLHARKDGADELAVDRRSGGAALRGARAGLEGDDDPAGDRARGRRGGRRRCRNHPEGGGGEGGEHGAAGSHLPTGRPPWGQTSPPRQRD